MCFVWTQWAGKRYNRLGENEIFGTFKSCCTLAVHTWACGPAERYSPSVPVCGLSNGGRQWGTEPWGGLTRLLCFHFQHRCAPISRSMQEMTQWVGVLFLRYSVYVFSFFLFFLFCAENRRRKSMWCKSKAMNYFWAWMRGELFRRRGYRYHKWLSLLEV